MIRIKDIAQEAGVSPTTVSNVIHGNTKKVSPETIDRIQKLLKQHSYVPSMGALMLASRSSKIIGVLISGKKTHNPTVENDAFTNILIRSLESEIYRRGYYMLLHFSSAAEENLSFATAWNVEGLITIGLSAQDNLTLSKDGSLPLVSIDVYHDKTPLPNVGLNDYYGGFLMTEYLIRQGHHHILFIADNDVGVDHQRFQGVADALQKAGPDYAAAKHLLIPSEKQERLSYYHRHLTEIAATQDALFFASDYYALEASCCLHEQGIRIPEDISLAGFDDNECARLCTPQLTTVRQNVAQKAVSATQKLFSILANKPVPLSDQLPVELIIRDSVQQRLPK